MTPPVLGRVTSREAPPLQREASGGSTWGNRRPPGGSRPVQGMEPLCSLGTQQGTARDALHAPVLGSRECSPFFRFWEDHTSSVQDSGVVRTPA